MLFKQPTPSIPVAEKASWIAQVCLVGLGVTSILALIPQIQNVRRGFQVQMFDRTADRMADITKTLIDNISVLDIFRRRDITDPMDIDEKSLLICELILDGLDTELLRKSVFADVTKSLPSIEIWIVDVFREYAMLGRALERRLNWYSADILNLKRRADHLTKINQGTNEFITWKDVNECKLFRRGFRLNSARLPFGVLTGDEVVAKHQKRQIRGIVKNVRLDHKQGNAHCSLRRKHGSYIQPEDLAT